MCPIFLGHLKIINFTLEQILLLGVPIRKHMTVYSASVKDR